MSTKYGSRISEFDRWMHQNDIRLTEHALDRYDERTPVDSPDPCVAWERGQFVPDPQLYERTLSIDHAKVYVDHSDGWAAIFVVADDNERAVTTVLSDATLRSEVKAYTFSFGPHEPRGGDSA